MIDHRPQDFTKKFPQRSRVGNDDANGNDDKLIKIKRPQGGGTVRSIPIKDYQASIAHNIGTLRRSVAPQSQFESLVSEPERSVYAPSKRRVSVIGNLHHRTPSQITCTASQFEYGGDAPRKLFCHFCDNQRDCYCVDINAMDKDTENNQYFNKIEEQRSRDGSDVDEYFRRSSRRRFESKDRRASKRACVSSRRNATTIAVTGMGNEKAAEATQASQLGEGHVGQKISAYEQNARRSLRGANPKYRSVFEVKGHRAIGVPLVGMHNACGLPVVATWQDHEILEPLRVSRRIVGTLGPIYRSPRTLPNVRRRNQPKRKAPQPDRAMIIARDIDRNVKRSTIKSVVHLDAINGGLSRKKHRRSSFTTSKMGSLSSKNSFKKKTVRSPKRQGIKVSSLVDTFGKKPVKASSAKRTTLYAKDDGEEAVQVLKNLCLNPLARSNSETDMMW